MAAVAVAIGCVPSVSFGAYSAQGSPPAAM